MRAIKAKIDGSVIIFLAEPDIQAYMAERQAVVEKYDRLTAELASVWEAYRKDLKNLQLLFTISGIINELSALALKPTKVEQPNE